LPVVHENDVKEPSTIEVHDVPAFNRLLSFAVLVRLTRETGPDGARRVPEDAIAGLELRRGGTPAACQPIGEQLVGRRLMRPHGDRRD
jgi:hypothetical protein